MPKQKTSEDKVKELSSKDVKMNHCTAQFNHCPGIIIILFRVVVFIITINITIIIIVIIIFLTIIILTIIIIIFFAIIIIFFYTPSPSFFTTTQTSVKGEVELAGAVNSAYEPDDARNGAASTAAATGVGDGRKNGAGVVHLTQAEDVKLTFSSTLNNGRAMESAEKTSPTTTTTTTTKTSKGERQTLEASEFRRGGLARVGGGGETKATSLNGKRHGEMEEKVEGEYEEDEEEEKRNLEEDLRRMSFVQYVKGTVYSKGF